MRAGFRAHDCRRQNLGSASILLAYPAVLRAAHEERVWSSFAHPQKVRRAAFPSRRLIQPPQPSYPERRALLQLADVDPLIHGVGLGNASRPDGDGGDASFSEECGIAKPRRAGESGTVDDEFLHERITSGRVETRRGFATRRHLGRSIVRCHKRLQ